MIVRAMRTFPLISLLLLLLLSQPGCATAPRGEAAGGGGAPVVQQLAKSTRSWSGELLPPYPTGQPEITILRIEVPPGARLEPHRHPVINAGILTKGELTVVTADGLTLQLKAGDSMVEVVNTLHYGFNPGADPAEIVVFYAGEQGGPVTVKER